MDPRIRAQIVASAQRHGVDPVAALAVWSVENPSLVTTGDNGTSFGPFSLHWGGAMPRQYVGNSKASHAFATSPAGIDYAISQMARSGARGKTGKAAVTAIVANFERPADVPGEIAAAWSNYGQMRVGARRATPTARRAAPTALSNDAFRSALAAELLSMSARTMQGLGPDFSGLMSLAAMRQALPADAPAPSAAPGRAVGPGGLLLPIAQNAYSRGGGAKEHASRPLGNWQSDRAVDLMAKAGTPIYAVATGVISPDGLGFGRSSGKGTVVGNRLHLKTKNDTYFYQHMGAFAPGIRPGVKVKKGQVIGYVGDYGDRIGGNHLHFAAQYGNPFGLL